ncbi:DUF177 domain-containing protein [Bacillus sp. FJAT-50079]|nr:YceD family protein [Bacillus sp. FJAT-50079]MBS4207733.1 DUF177 domain-containing protein [Bacillus sp. FJAT-50079]
MKWSVVQLQNFRGREFEFDEVIDITDDLKQRNPEIRDLTPVHVTGKANVDSKKVSFHLHVTGTYTLPCSRTLEDVKVPIDVHSIETFLLQPLDYELGEMEIVHEADGGNINLIPVIEELLLLEVPLQVFSEEEINGATQVGNGWEVMTEEQFLNKQELAKKKIDPRLADLAKLLNENNE